MSATATDEQIAKFNLKAGDVIITKDSETADDIAIAAFVPEDLPGVVCGYHLSMVRPVPGVSGRFIKRYFDSAFAKACFAVRANGLTRVGLGQYEIDNVEVPLPPFGEQAVIAAFLDRETGKIDALVEEQHQLIELLKEKRQAVISHAVTKGLDPTAPMKDSGVEWLGEVPMHWEVKRLRFLCDIETGDGDTVDAVEEGQYPFYVRSPVVERIGRYSHDCEAVLTSGDGAGVGKIFHHARGKFTAHQRVYIFRTFRSVAATFFFHYLRENFFKVALEGGAKSTVDSLRRPLIANFWMTVPPSKEQEEIVAEIDRLSSKFEQLIVEAAAAVELLQERRSGLISAAVTGKIDVRAQASAQSPAPADRSAEAA